MEKKIAEYDFSKAWGCKMAPATEDNQPFKTDDEAKQARDTFAKMLRNKTGYRVVKRNLTGQLRKYWGWMEPCGICGTIYSIEVYEK